MKKNAAPINARTLAVEALLKIERDQAYSHITLDALLRKHKPKEQDRRLATRLVYGTLAMQARLDFELTKAINRPLVKGTDPFTRVNLRMALYQLRHLDRIAPYAAVDAAVSMVKAQRGQRVAGFVNAVLRRLGRENLIDDLAKSGDEAAQMGLEFSLPKAIARRLIARLGLQEARQCASRFNQVAPLTLRVNLAHISREELATRVQADLGRPPRALRATQFSPELSTAIKQGLVSIQDEGSQLIGELASEGLGPEAHFWDTCAGQGGKSSQLVDHFTTTAPNTRFFVSDLHPAKLKRLAKLIHNTHPDFKLQSFAADLSETLPTDLPLPEQGFDGILVDAPCSGLGLIGRHPETRWRARTQDIPKLVKLQRQILRTAIAHLAPGGYLTYAVCTFTREESFEQKDWLLAEFPQLRLAPPERPHLQAICDGAEFTLWPHRHDTDAFYAVRLRRGEQ